MSDVEWLLLLLVIVAGFVLYELFGVDPRFKHVHSVSYLAQRKRWLAVLIGAIFLAGGVLGVVWWTQHLQSHSIFK